MKKLADSTRLAIQASIAVALASLVSQVFQFDRSYWAVMTAMLLIFQTWGESVKKAVERVAMTVIGGVTGTVLYFVLQPSHMTMFFIILICVSCMVFFFEISYRLCVFFITIFVVFLFAILLGWDAQILWARIYETAMGAVIAVITTAIVLPLRESKDLRYIFSDFLQLSDATVSLSFHALYSDEEKPALRTKRMKLIKQYLELRSRMRVILYELFFTALPRNTTKTIMLKLGVLMHYVTSFLMVVAEAQENSSLQLIESDMDGLRDSIHQNFEVLIAKLEQRPAQYVFKDVDERCTVLRSRLITCMESSDLPQERWFDDHSMIYFLRKTNEMLGELVAVVPDR